jgi:glycosyltransferase involved in cell wall biosynthesis
VPTELSSGRGLSSLGWAATVVARARHRAPVSAEPPATVSVIVPIWNVEPWLRACLDSVVGQSLGLDRLDVILVDDGSTDASGAIADEYSGRYPHVTVVHEPNSGGPGHPRNVGLGRATGTFVFFLDADDYLGTEALERLVAMAQRHRSDIVIGKVIPIEARPHHVDGGLFARNLARADLELVYRSSNVLKLFRRSFLVRTGIRFDDASQGGEDGDVMARLYPQARTISVVADYDCYYARGRPGSQTTRLDRTDDLVAYIERIERERIVPVAASRRAGPRRDVLVVKHVRKLLRLFGRRWLALEPDEQRRVFDRGAAVMRRWNTALIDRTLPPWAAIRSYCLVHDRLHELVDIVSTPARRAFEDPIIEGGRLFARYPHFRDGTGIPDRCFDITRHVAVVQSLDALDLIDGRLHLSGSSYVSLVGGTTKLQLRRWPTGPRYLVRPTVVATPQLRDTVRWYRDAGYDATIDLTRAVRGGPVPAGIWTIRLETVTPRVRRTAALRCAGPASAGPAPSTPSGDTSGRAVYVVADGTVRLRIGKPGRGVRCLERVEGLGVRYARSATFILSATRFGRVVRMGIEDLTPRVAAGLFRDWAVAEISSAKAPWRRGRRTPGR